MSVDNFGIENTKIFEFIQKLMVEFTSGTRKGTRMALENLPCLMECGSMMVIDVLRDIYHQAFDHNVPK